MNAPPPTCEVCGGAGHTGLFGHPGFGLIKFPCPDCSAVVTLADTGNVDHYTRPADAVALDSFDIHFDDDTVIKPLLAGGAGACCVGMLCGLAPSIIGFIVGSRWLRSKWLHNFVSQWGAMFLCLWAASGCAMFVCYAAGICGKNAGWGLLGRCCFNRLDECSLVCQGLNLIFFFGVLIYQFIGRPWWRDIYEVCCDECRTYCMETKSPFCMQDITMQQPDVIQNETSRNFDCNILPPMSNGSTCSIWAHDCSIFKADCSEPLVPKCRVNGDCVTADWCDISDGHEWCYHDMNKGANHFGPCHSLEAMQESGVFISGCVICYAVAVIVVVSSQIVRRSSHRLMSEQEREGQERGGPIFTIASKPISSTISTPAQPPVQALVVEQAGYPQVSTVSTSAEPGSPQSPPSQAIVLGRAAPPQMLATSTLVSAGSAVRPPVKSMGQATAVQSPAEYLDPAALDNPSSDFAQPAADTPDAVAIEFGSNAASDGAIQKQASTASVYAKTNWKRLFLASACVGNSILIVVLMAVTIPTILGNSPW